MNAAQSLGLLPRYEGGDCSESAPQDKAEPVGGNETILLVEDERSIRRTVQLFLRNCGYRSGVSGALRRPPDSFKLKVTTTGRWSEPTCGPRRRSWITIDSLCRQWSMGMRSG